MFKLKKINVAILDDYQNVSHRFVDWGKLNQKIELDIFREYINFTGSDIKSILRNMLNFEKR